MLFNDSILTLLLSTRGVAGGVRPRVVGAPLRTIAEEPAPAPHLAHPEGCAALRAVLFTVPRVSRS